MFRGLSPAGVSAFGGPAGAPINPWRLADNTIDQRPSTCWIERLRRCDGASSVATPFQPHGTRLAGRIGQQTAPKAPRCRTTPGPNSDAVTTSAVAPQRRRYAATVRQSCRCDGATEQCNTVSGGAVETCDRIANEKADRLGSAVLVGACGVFCFQQQPTRRVRPNARQNRQFDRSAAISSCPRD